MNNFWTLILGLTVGVHALIRDHDGKCKLTRGCCKPRLGLDRRYAMQAADKLRIPVMFTNSEEFVVSVYVLRKPSETLAVALPFQYTAHKQLHWSGGQFTASHCTLHPHQYNHQFQRISNSICISSLTTVISNSHATHLVYTVHLAARQLASAEKHCLQPLKVS
jgi:hypothetical protein